jgi:2-hydroxycyclohexanecarboxyl-CoA dehydrogenase
MSRVAVVTGAASGMGLAISRRLAAQEHRVALLDLDGDAAERAADDLRRRGAQALAVEVDVTDRVRSRS